MASIGEPAVIFPNKGTLVTSSFSGTYSFSTNNSMALFLESSLRMIPFFSKFFKWAWIVAGDEMSKALPISLTVGGYPCETIYDFT